MKPSILLAATLLLPGTFIPVAHAASFDCAKARSYVEHQVCDDEKLSAPNPVSANAIVADMAPAIKGTSAREPNVVSAALPTLRATSTFSFKIQDMSQHPRIAGRRGAVTRASEGKTLVVVRYSYKNLTTEPIGSMRLPSLALVSPDGVRSQSDATASKAFLAGTETKDTLTNDRNPILTPGMTANDAGVFEVLTDALAKPGWSLVIEADEDVKVPLALQN